MLTGHGGNIYDIATRLGCMPSEITETNLMLVERLLNLSLR
jgi:hypothetical protein